MTGTEEALPATNAARTDTGGPSGAGTGRLLALAVFTLVGMGGLGSWLVIGVQDREWSAVLLGDRSVAFHIALGTAIGMLIGGAAWALITRPFMGPVRSKYTGLLGPLLTGPWIRLFVSVCAGVGEELLFRGALQHWLGIPVTAVVFVALHGYLDPRSWRISLYGAFLVVAMVVIGSMAQLYGLLGPMAAHTVIDIILLEMLHRDWRRTMAGHG